MSMYMSILYKCPAFVLYPNFTRSTEETIVDFWSWIYTEHYIEHIRDHNIH